MSGRQFLMRYVVIFLMSMLFVALGLFAIYMDKRETRRRNLR